MPHRNNNDNPDEARRPSWSSRRQRRRLPERARISVGQLVRRRAVVSATQPEGTLGDADINAEALSGDYFSRWARHRRLNLTWGQLELFEGRADLDTVADIPQRARNFAHRVLTGDSDGLYQIPSTHAGDPFGVSTCAEALYVEEMQNVLLDFAGDVEDVVAIVLDAYALRDVSFLTVAPVGRDIFPHRL